MEGGAGGHNFQRDPPRDHPCQIWFNLLQRFQRRRFKCNLMLLHAFPSMSVSSLRGFPKNCVYRHGGFNCFIKYLHRKSTNFSLMILKVLQNVHLLDLYIKAIIFFFFYNYIHVFNSSQND